MNKKRGMIWVVLVLIIIMARSIFAVYYQHNNQTMAQYQHKFYKVPLFLNNHDHRNC